MALVPDNFALRAMARASAFGLLVALAAGCSSTLTLDGEEWDGNLDDDTGGEEGETGGEDDGSEMDPEGPLVVPECNPEQDTVIGFDPVDANAEVSPALARAAILAGDGSLADVPIARHEFLNYYQLAYAPALPGELAIAAELYLPDYLEPTDWVLQVGVNGPESMADARPPANLALVLDASSFGSEKELDLTKASAEALIGSLHKGDRLSVIQLGQELPALIEAYEVEGMDDPYLLDLIDGLEPGGDPDLALALETAYGLAEAGYAEEWINRVVYIGSDLDGLEVIPKDIVKSHAGMPGEVGIHLVGAGVGEPGAYDGSLVQELTAVGHGTSLFVGDAQEGWRAFHERFMSTMAVAARDVSVRVELPPGFRPAGADEAAEAVSPWSDPVPADLPAGRAIVFHEALESCAPDSLDATSPLTVQVSWRDAADLAPRETSVELDFGQAMQAAPSRMLAGRAIVAYADALAAWQAAEDEAEKQAAIAEAMPVIEKALDALPEDEQLQEISELLALLAG
jgi:Ca-activated chloride channel family protein